MAKLITIYWRDIPAQVIGRVGRDNHKLELSPRFAEAIDRAAMRAGKGSSDLYLAEWRRESEETESAEIGAQVARRVAELEAAWPPELLERVTKAGGLLAKANGTNTTPTTASAEPGDSP